MARQHREAQATLRIKDSLFPLDVLVDVTYPNWKYARRGLITREEQSGQIIVKFTWKPGMWRAVYAGGNPRIVRVDTGEEWSCWEKGL